MRWGFRWWSAPETGYHRSDDVWQTKRDMYHFAMAGIDFLYFDITNGYLYEDAMKVFLDTCLELRADGQMTPYLVPWCFGTAVNGSVDIAHTDMVFLDKIWASGARTAAVDLSGVNYSGDVWLADHNPAGTFIAILEINFY